MSSFIPYAAAVCAAVAAWLIRGALAVESSAPNSPKLGIVPPLWELALFVLAGGCLVFLLKPSRDRVLPLFATALCVLPWVPGLRAPALLVWTGPLAIVVWFAAMGAAIFCERWPRVPALGRAQSPRAQMVLAGAAAFVVFGVVAFGARAMVPGGDEPHYLIITQSLLYDRDLQIENNHTRRDYAPYFRGILRPDYFQRGTNGAIYSIHAPGLSAIVTPAFAIGGYRGVVVVRAVLAEAGSALVWKLAFELTGRAPAAWFAAVGLATATPIAFHAFTLYPDGPAGLLVLTGAWALLRLRDRSDARLSAVSSRPVIWLLHGMALALLPWLHSRFAVLAGMLGLLILLRMPRTRDGWRMAAAFLIVPVVAGLAWFGYFWIIYGTPNPEAPYGMYSRTQNVSWSYVTSGLTGLLFDQQFGILIYAPVFLMALAGLAVMLFRIARERGDLPSRAGERRLAIELALVALPYLALTTQLRMWWAGWSAPGRFAVPILWVAGLFLARAWSASRGRAARGTALAALLVSALTTALLAFVNGGRLAYNVRDGYSLWLQWLSPLADLPLGLPSFFRWSTVEWALDLQIVVTVGLFLLAFIVLRWADRRVRGNGAFALLLLGAYAVAAIAGIVVLWRVNDSTGIRAASGQLQLLRAAAKEHRLGLAYADFPFAVRSVDALVRQMRIESPPRMLGGGDPPALVLPGWFPAGRYEVHAGMATDSEYEIRVLRAGPSIRTGSGKDLSVPLVLPVDVPAFILRGAGLQSAWLRPLHVATSHERFDDARAQSARRYGTTTVWFLDGDAFNEPSGLWVRGAADSTIVLQHDSGGGADLLLRNGASPNKVALEAGDGTWRRDLALAPGQEQMIQVPIDERRGATRLQVTSSSGFRPSEVEAGSRDTRFLGVWLEPR